MEEINELSAFQILTFNNFGEKDREKFVVVYSDSYSEYALFLNKEKDNVISILDIFNRKVISKAHLLLELSKDLNYFSFIEGIKKVDNIDLKLTETILPEDLINYFYQFSPIVKENKNIKEIKPKFLFSDQFKNIFQDREENVITPLFLENSFVNYYIENGTNIKVKSGNANGYYVSELMISNINVLISFGLFNLIRYFSTNESNEYFTIIPNPKVNLRNVSGIVNHIKNAGEKNFEKIIFLYNSNNIEEIILLLEFFVLWGKIKSQYDLTLERFDNKFILNIFPPKDVKVLKLTQFFANLNKELLNVMNITSKDEEKKEIIKDFFFDLKSFNFPNYKFHTISFQPKVQMIEILLGRFNNLLFGNDTNVEFINVKSTNIVVDEVYEGAL
jgi:hypothetical protein